MGRGSGVGPGGRPWQCRYRTWDIEDELKQRCHDASCRELARAVVSRGFRVGPPQFAIGDRQPQRLEDGTLAWPVLLLYPEVGAQEAIEAARESDPFSAHLEVRAAGVGC